MRVALRSLRFRLVAWFTLGVVIIVGIFLVAIFRHLEDELQRKTAALDYPEHPEWKLHGSVESEEEIRDIMEELIETPLLLTLPLLIAVVSLGWFLAQKSLRPIVELNRQLVDLRAQNLAPNLVLREGDREFREHVENLNLLLARLRKSFDDLRDYAAKVAHELRTPLTILRLKVEKAESEISPVLREEVLNELERLTHIVSQSLLIAQAERGSIEWKLEAFDLAAMLEDLGEDFRMLASEEGRALALRVPGRCEVVSDPRHIRQILHGYLTNAVKHGIGTIDVSLVLANKEAVVEIINDVRELDAGDAVPKGLGLGLRVVRALIGAQDRVSSTASEENGVYSVRLVIPAPIDPSSGREGLN